MKGKSHYVTEKFCHLRKTKEKFAYPKTGILELYLNEDKCASTYLDLSRLSESF